ncbi:cytochrome oxidase putative small subunit CydP [Dokdonella sp.]|uniref:cytochrome oxidase putative small subunit CydP n=1 Tax=Dokdonella sp. TaxID=2291710 RepID=UPI003528C3D8
MPPDRTEMAGSWFRGRGGKRFALEFALIITIKLVLLVLLWVVVIRPLPRADTSPTAIEQHFSAPSSKEPSR